MADGDAFASVRLGLFQPERGLYIAPIRHHSPACAWAVRALIREVKPRHVLIEAPADLQEHVDLLLHPETRPPVALAVLLTEGSTRRIAAYYPLCTHAPEYVALQEARAAGAEIRFIDLPSSTRMAQQCVPDDGPFSLGEDGRFDTGKYIQALRERLGCRDGFELWDHLFESRLGDADWKRLLEDVGAYCAGMRAATSDEEIASTGDAAREAQMATGILEALDAGGPVVAVVGGFHAPALIEAVETGARAKFQTGKDSARSYLIRYSFEALDALNGYAAGLPQPAWYDHLWTSANAAGGEPIWRRTALDLTAGFVKRSRDQGYPIAVPQQVEMVRAAETLALLRGRPGALRYDLIDGARTALVKGEAGHREAWTERLVDYLRGDAIGDVPLSAGSPPLIEDARALARTHRFDISDGARRRRRLDIRRKPSQLEASRFLHAMTMLSSGFAEREAGPDYVNETLTELLFEDWSYAWSPVVEGRLIERATRADTVRAACLDLLADRRGQMIASGQARDIAGMAGLLAQGLLAGLGADLAPFVAELAGDIEAHGDFAAVAHTLRRLHVIERSAGPLRPPPELDLGRICQSAYRRIVYLCDELPGTPPDRAGERTEALRIVSELLGGGEADDLDRQLFDDAIDRVAAASPPPEILGAVLAICVQARRREAAELARALAGQFAGSAVETAERIGVLRGVMQTTPQLILHNADVLGVVDRFLAELAEGEFMELLPHLRLAFTALSPREIDQLAELLARRHGGQAGAYLAVSSATEADLARGVLLDRQLAASVAADGLNQWAQAEGGRQ